jgi:antirestriction protein ArdC
MSTQSKPASTRQDVYSEITSQLITAIETNPGKPELPWRKSSGPLFMPVNALTQNAYNGINIVSLWVAAEVKSFTTPVWATYKQWLELGAQVRKDEKSSLVIFYKEFDAEPNPEDASDDGKRRVARASRVFNAAQVDGYAGAAQPDPLGPIERIAAADLFVNATGARVEHGGDRAYAQRVHFGKGTVNIRCDRAGHFGQLDHLILGGILQMGCQPTGIPGLKPRDDHGHRPRILVPRNTVMACAPGR